MQGDDLVTDDVVARGEVGRDGNGPGVVVGDQLVGGPVAGVGARDPAGLGELDPLEGGGGDGAAVAVAGGDVVNYGAGEWDVSMRSTSER